MLAATDYYSADDVPKILEKVNPTLGKGAQYVTIDAETFKGFLTGAGMPDFAALEMYENMAFMDEFGYYGKEGLEWSLSVSFFVFCFYFFFLFLDSCCRFFVCGVCVCSLIYFIFFCSCLTKSRLRSRNTLPRQPSGINPRDRRPNWESGWKKLVYMII